MRAASRQELRDEHTAGASEPKVNGAALPDDEAAALVPPKPKPSVVASAAADDAIGATVAPNAAAGHADSAADVDVVDGAHWVPPVGCDPSALSDAGVPVRRWCCQHPPCNILHSQSSLHAT